MVLVCTFKSGSSWRILPHCTYLAGGTVSIPQLQPPQDLIYDTTDCVVSATAMKRLRTERHQVCVSRGDTDYGGKYGKIGHFPFFSRDQSGPFLACFCDRTPCFFLWGWRTESTSKQPNFCGRPHRCSTPLTKRTKRLSFPELFFLVVLLAFWLACTPSVSQMKRERDAYRAERDLMCEQKEQIRIEVWMKVNLFAASMLGNMM